MEAILHGQLFYCFLPDMCWQESGLVFNCRSAGVSGRSTLCNDYIVDTCETNCLYTKKSLQYYVVRLVYCGRAKIRPRLLLRGLIAVAVLYFLLSESLAVFAGLHNGVVACASSNQSLEERAADFLEKVAGFNDSIHPIAQSSLYNLPLPNGHVQTDVDLGICCDSYVFNVKVSFVDGKLWKYDSSLPSSYLEGDSNLDDSLSIAVTSAKNYRSLCETEYCNDLDEVISTALLSRSLVVETNEAFLKVSHVENCSTPLDYKRCTVLRYFKKIDNQYTCGFLSISMIVSKAGLITEFIDNMALYHVGCTTLCVAREQAINRSKPYAETYGEAHSQSIVATDASLSWIADAARGDDYALYPAWGIRTWFDKTNSEGVNGHSVVIWADNGQIASCKPQGFYHPEADDNMSWRLGILVTSAAAILAIPIGLVALRRRSKKR